MIDLELMDLELRKEALDSILTKQERDKNLMNWLIFIVCLIICIVIIVIW